MNIKGLSKKFDKILLSISDVDLKEWDDFDHAQEEYEKFFEEDYIQTETDFEIPLLEKSLGFYSKRGM